MKKDAAQKDEIECPFSNDADFLTKWKEWLQYRKERRLPNYVPTGLKRTFEKLVGESGNNSKVAIQMIDQSIGNNWQGIFALKNVRNGTKSTVNDDKLKATITAHINGW